MSEKARPVRDFVKKAWSLGKGAVLNWIDKLVNGAIDRIPFQKKGPLDR